MSAPVRIRASWRIEYDGVVLNPGDEAMVDARGAARLVETGAATLVSGPAIDPDAAGARTSATAGKAASDKARDRG